MVATGLCFVSLFALALGNPVTRRAMTVHESRSKIPEGFVKQGPAPADTVLNMRIVLKQFDPAGLEDALMAVSTPGNARFGKHLTKDQVSVDSGSIGVSSTDSITGRGVRRADEGDCGRRQRLLPGEQRYHEDRVACR